MQGRLFSPGEARSANACCKPARCAVLGAEDAGGEVVDAEEEAQPIGSLSSLDMPTQSKRDEHDLTH